VCQCEASRRGAQREARRRISIPRFRRRRHVLFDLLLLLFFLFLFLFLFLLEKWRLLLLDFIHV